MLRLPLYLCVMVLVSSCGGGKDESSPVEISNRAPVITDPGVLSVREGVSDVVSLSGTDADGNSLTFEIVSGDDQSLFTITSAGNLRFVIAPDFEAPSDANTDNKYLVNVELTDGTLTDSVSLVVSVTDAFEGRVVDAPISGASVFIDLNGNNQLDADEPSGTTDTSGYFQVDSFSLPIVGDAKVVSMGGLDIKTGKALTDLALVSDVPTDKTQPVNVTPLTTVISAATTPEEKAQVLSAFGISGSVEELLTSDGWAKAESGDENAKANQRINQQIGLLLQTAITLTDDADESTDVSVALAQSVAKQISVVAQSEGSIDLTASTTIKTVLTDAAQEITPSIDVASSVVKAVADAVAMVNAVVANITLDPLSDMATEIVVAAQGSLQASVLDVVSGSVTVDSFAEEAGAVKLFENIAVAADAPDSDSDGIPDMLDFDDDNDGVADGSDAFPLDSTESIDIDGDGIGNNADSDDDNDGVADDADTFPLDSTESIDTDGDGIGNNADTDDDGDGVADALDAFPLDETETIDTDGDGIGNNIDAFPLDETETIDTDGDGIGNNADSDNDGDGVADDLDPEPLDNTKTPPLAIIDTDISTGDAPLRVVFNSNSSIAGNPEDITDSIISTTWNSGDGTAGSRSTFEHIYHSEGDYIVSLTVTNSDGYSHVETYPIKVTSNNSLISISGSISIPSTYVVDSDVNDQDTTPQSNDLFSSAQQISRSSVVSGYVNQPLFGESGNSWLLGDIKDVYKVNALGGEVINLIVGNKNLGDLDIRISHLDGTYIDFSVGDSTLYESITLPDVSDTYFIVVEAFSGASNYLLEIGGSKSLAMHGWNNEVEIADNELLVKENKNYSMTSIRQTQKTMGVQKVDTIHATDYSGPVLYKLDTSTFLSSSIKSGQSPRSASWMPFSSPKYETLLKAKELKALNHFEYVEPNFIRKQSALPNDPLYPFQSWHYEQINLPEAWDRSTGMGNVKVAVIDTGVVLDHPDLVHRVTNDGYDFISSVFSSGDGDGVDSDASDPGNGRDNAECMWSERQSSSFHGTHVAGTVGATGNDSFGLTGVNWNVDIMPIRVLGCDGGDNYDIAQAIYYAAGLPNAYGLSPNSPADIINLSLGSSYSSYFERAAIQAAIDSGVIVIAAAGNEAMDGNPLSYPASYPGVISVGAVNPEGNRAWYSNFNYAVDIVAPGGYDHSNPFSTTPGMIYSTSANITNGNILPSFKWSVGTSMAAPHVAGVVSLMKGIYPSLTPRDLDDALSLGLMTVDIGALGQDSEYGFGLIDANKALQTAEGFVSGVNTNFPPLLNLTAYEIDLGVTAMEFTVQAYNAGGGRISITDVVASNQNISISAPNSDDGLGEYTVSLDRNNLSQGVYTESIQFSSDYGSRLLTLYFEELASNAEQPDGGKIYILLYNLISDDPIKQVSSVAVSGQYSFTIEDINPDVYYLVTGSDIDNDGFICGPAEACAYWPSREQEDLIVANKSFDNIDMVLRFEAQVSASSQALSTVNSSKALKIKSNCEKEIDVNRSDKVRIYPCVEQHLRDLK